MTQKTALITGASKRIGAQIASDLASDGWTIGLHYKSSEQEARDLAQKIKAQGGTAEPLKADLSSSENCNTLIEQCSVKLGPVSLLINNASLFEEDHLGTLSPELWDAHMNINVRAPAFLSQSFVQNLPKGEKGQIINMIDQRVWKLTPQFMSYTISKAALWTLTQQLAQDLAPQIRVNAIGPGPTLRGARQTEEDFTRQQASVPLETGATPAQISDAIKFLLAQPSITGQMIALDGGQHLAWQTPDVLDITE